MNAYVTLSGEASVSLEVKKSEFIGHAAPVRSEEEARDFIAKIRKKHAAARHNVYAYLLAENQIMRYSDDGEPQGTAGLPVLGVLRKGGITDAVIVVTRYFGGILLGTGGLVRAYSEAARAAAEAAGRASFVLYDECSLSMSYSFYPRFLPLLKGLPIIVDQTDFGAEVSVRLAVRSDAFTRFGELLAKAGAGSVLLHKTGVRLDAENPASE